MVIHDLQNEIRETLRKSRIEAYSLETSLLLQHVLACDRQWLLLHRQEQLTAEQEGWARSLARRRVEGIPLQYLLGSWEFYGLEFEVGEGVLIPRPDTERLCDIAIEQIGEGPAVVADLCAGSGCVAAAVQCACAQAQMFAVELSELALPYLRRNLARNAPQVTVIEGDVLSGDTPGLLPQLDAILSNPPYLTAEDMEHLQREVRHEPALALYGEEDGLGFYRGITQLWKHRLRPGGLLAYEIGINQHTAVAKILRENGFSRIQYAEDLHGVIRVVYGFTNKEENHGG